MHKKIQEKFIQKITGLNKEQLFLNEPNLDTENQKKLEEYTSRYNQGEPLEYILEEAEFYGLDFFIDKRVLIPRNDTEILVEEAIKIWKMQSLLIDIGTGSSCIPISIIKNQKTKIKNCYAVDISKDALDVAEINIKKHGLEEKIEIINGDLLKPFLSKPFSLNPAKDGITLQHDSNLIITANLPYIKQNDFENMDKQVYENEPKLALYGGEKTGFELYETLIKQCLELKKHLQLTTYNLLLLIEIGFDQKEVSKNFLENNGLKFEFFKDANKIDRVIKIYF